MPAQRRRRKKREKEKKEKKKNAHEENQLDLSHKTAETKEKCTSATTNTPKMSSSESIDLDSTTTTPRKDIKREATPLTSNDNTLAHSFDTNESNVMPKSLIVSVQEETRDKRHKYADVAFPVNGADFDTRGVILSDPDISYTCYQGEHQLASLTALIEKDLSEPYSIYTYRYFTNNWPDLTFLAMSGGACVGTIVCKLAPNDNTGKMEGYIAMLAVDKSYRKRAIGSTLVRLVIEAMKDKKADVVVLETEITNKGAISLYQRLNFTRDCRLEKYYLNGVDAFRLKLWLTPPLLIPHFKM